MKEEETRVEQGPHEGFQILCIAGEIAMRLIEKGQNYAWMIPFAYSLHLNNASISTAVPTEFSLLIGH